MTPIYLDNNATTRVADEVLAAMLPYFQQQYGNPSSIHRFGAELAAHIETARQQVADLLGCRLTELVFTSGGTESNNTAIAGVLAAHPKLKHIITTAVEHDSVFTPLAPLERKGYEITRLPVDEQGMIDLEDLSDAINPQTALVTIMHANNETGVIFPIEEIGTICREREVTFHCDGVQATGKIPFHLNDLSVDLYTASSHKLHGAKGTGALYIRRGLKFRSLILGGHQEHGRRGGTENVPGIIGFGRASALAMDRMDDWDSVAVRRDRFERAVLKQLSGAVVNGGRSARLPNTSNIRFAGVESESLLLELDQEGICASPGSACSSGKIEPSHVLMAMGLEAEDAASAVRFSLSQETTDAEIDIVLEKLPQLVRKLEGLSPYATKREF